MNESLLSENKNAFIRLGLFFESLLRDDGEKNAVKTEFDELMLKVKQKNPWFTEENVRFAFRAWVEALKENNIEEWLKPYRAKLRNTAAKTIGVINAGNIPLVGFHDLMCVVISGNNYLGKNSSDDPYLLPYVAEKLFQIEPTLKNKIAFTEKLSGFDAVIATGSNNSARYFNYYFGKYPHVIRMNRNAVAVLDENESERDFKNLGNDIFQYFGLGCRNVSKLFVPRNFNFDKLFENIESFSGVAQHNKYMNNYDYNSSMYLMKQIPFLDNGFLILKEDESIPSPISVIHYEFYDDIKSVEEKLNTEKEKIQCVVSNFPLRVGNGFVVGFGEAQHPRLWDYADGVDTMKFLTEL